MVLCVLIDNNSGNYLFANDTKPLYEAMQHDYLLEH